MAYKDHIMGKGKARVKTLNKKAHDVLEADNWGHAPFKMRTPFRCWKNYTQKGYKKKGGRTVPNCVPKK
tara:strand:- start:10385 stop:10591 length:207 start_codon:yes stop_codon:yes gene_type:complete